MADHDLVLLVKRFALFFFGFWPVFLLVSLSAAPGRAANLEERVRTARKACLTGDVNKGVDLLADLFLDTRDITHIYNQGRCFEQNRKFAEAISRFQEFLVKGKNLSEEDRADAQKHIELCRSNLDQGPPKPEAAVAPPPPIASAPPPDQEVHQEVPATVSPPEPAATLVAKTVDEPNPGSSLRMAGIAAVALGVASGLTGLILNLKYNRMTHDLEGEYHESTASSSTTYKRLSEVGYIAGGVCVVGGTLVYYLGWRQGRAVLAPAPVAGNGGVVFAGVF